MLSWRTGGWTAAVDLEGHSDGVIVKSNTEARRIAKESFIRRLANGTFLEKLLPGLLLIDTEGTIAGFPVILTRRLNGRPMARLRKTGYTKALPRLLAITRRMSSLNLPKFGFVGGDGVVSSGYATWGGYLRRIVARVLHQRGGEPLELLGPARVVVIKRILTRLLQAAVVGRPSLCHGDLRDENVLVNDDGGDPQIVGIVDWEMAESADPVWDLGCAYAHAGVHRRIWQEALDDPGVVPLSTSHLYDERLTFYTMLKQVDRLCAKSGGLLRSLEDIDGTMDRLLRSLRC